MKILKLTALILSFLLLLSSCGRGAEEKEQLPSEAVEAFNEETAMTKLLDVLGDKAEGKTLVPSGSEEIEGEMCFTMALGTSTSEKFTAEEHYAVGEENIYIMDIISGEYILFEK